MDLSKLGRTEKVLSAAGVLLLIFSFLPWFQVSVENISEHANAWSWPSGFNDWFPVLLLFVYGVLLALPAFGVAVAVPALAQPANRAFIGLVLSGLAVLLFAIQGLTYPGSGLGYSAGPAWGYYISLLIVLAAGAQSYLGFTQQGGSFAQVGASFKARTQAVQQQQQAPYGQAPQQGQYGQAPPFGGQPQDPQPQPPYGQQPPAPPAPPYSGS